MQILCCKINGIYYGSKKKKKDFSFTYFSTDKGIDFFIEQNESIERQVRLVHGIVCKWYTEDKNSSVNFSGERKAAY